MLRSKPLLEVQPSHENTQHIRAYGPSLELRPLMDGCCLLAGTADDQGCSVAHFLRISHDITACKPCLLSVSYTELTVPAQELLLPENANTVCGFLPMTSKAKSTTGIANCLIKQPLTANSRQPLVSEQYAGRINQNTVSSLSNSADSSMEWGDSVLQIRRQFAIDLPPRVRR